MTQTQSQWLAQRLQRFRPTTFRARITLVMTLLALIILALVDTSVYVGRYSQRLTNLDGVLLTNARMETAAFAESLEDGLHTSAARPQKLNLPSGSVYETYIQIEDRQGRILVRSSNLATLPPLRINKDSQQRVQTEGFAFEDIRLETRPMRCLCFPFVGAGQPLVALLAVSEEPMLNGMRSLATLLCGSLVVGGLAFALASSLLSLRLTRPLEQIAAFARDVGGTNLHARIPEVSCDTELRDVTGVLNEMLDRLETAFTQQQALVSAQQRFSADASHELRSPLSNLRGTVEVALRRPRAPEDYQETLALSLTEIKRLSRLVEDLLTLSRADAGQFALNRQLCDMGEIARNATRAYAACAEQNRIELQIFTPEATPIYGDRDRLRQVVDNLLDNALKYAPPATTVTLLARQCGPECCLEIRDQGPGIAPDDAARIFHRFYRADLSRARTSGGAGLGLAIAQAIIQAHSGSISVQAGHETGTTFCVCLPAGVASQLNRQENHDEA